jgi:hypothetical protein
VFHAGDGHDTVANRDGDAWDVARFYGIAHDDMWLARDGDALVLTVIGGDQSVKFQSWFAAEPTRPTGSTPTTTISTPPRSKRWWAPWPVTRCRHPPRPPCPRRCAPPSTRPGRRGRDLAGPLPAEPAWHRAPRGGLSRGARQCHPEARLRPAPAERSPERMGKARLIP